jgi:hypothetical protein
MITSYAEAERAQKKRIKRGKIGYSKAVRQFCAANLDLSDPHQSTTYYTLKLNLPHLNSKNELRDNVANKLHSRLMRVTADCFGRSFTDMCFSDSYFEDLFEFYIYASLETFISMLEEEFGDLEFDHYIEACNSDTVPVSICDIHRYIMLNTINSETVYAHTKDT